MSLQCGSDWLTGPSSSATTQRILFLCQQGANVLNEDGEHAKHDASHCHSMMTSVFSSKPHGAIVPKYILTGLLA